MADVRGMRELGASFNQAADTFGNLPIYSPDGLKQAAIAAGTAKAQNDLAGYQSTAADTKAMQDWQTAAQGRDDYGTEDYANDKVKFLQDAGASPTAITRAQMEAQAATHYGQTQDIAQDYVYNTVTDRVANELGQAYYKDHLKALQVQLVKDGATPQEAADKMRDAAIQAGKSYMTDKGIAVNIDHQTGNIMAQDKEGNKVPIDPDIAAQAYKIIGAKVPWDVMSAIQNEGIATGKAVGTMTAPTAAVASAPPGMTPAQAMTQSKVAEATLRSYQLEQVKEANKAAAAVTAAGGTAEEADAAHDRVMKRMQPIVDDAKKEVDTYHRIMSRTPAVQAMTAAPPPPPAPAPVNAAADAASLSGQPAAPAPVPTGATPAVNNMAAQSPQVLANTAAQLVQNLHLDRVNFNLPEVQAFLNTIDPQTRAAVTELMNHAANQ